MHVVPNERSAERTSSSCEFFCYFKGEPRYLVKQKGLHVGPLDKHTFPEKTRTQLHFNLPEEASATSSWTARARLGRSSEPPWESCAAHETTLAHQTMEPLTVMYPPPPLPSLQYSQSTVSQGLGCHSPSLLCSPGADQLASRDVKAWAQRSYSHRSAEFNINTLITGLLLVK